MVLDHKTRGRVHSSCSGMKLGHARATNSFGRRKAGGEALRVDLKIEVEVQPRSRFVSRRMTASSRRSRGAPRLRYQAGRRGSVRARRRGPTTPDTVAHP